MAGNRIQGIRTAVTNKQKYGEDYYARIGALGGSTRTAKTKLKGFGANRELARAAGAKGGTVSRRKSRNI